MTIELTAPETPGCDGSSRAFVDALGEAGIVELDREREALVIDRPVGNRRLYELDPAGAAALRAWLDRIWSDALTAFKAVAEQPNQEER